MNAKSIKADTAPDAFLERGRNAIAWASRRATGLSAVVLGVFVLLIVFAMTSRVQNRKNHRAADRFAAGMALLAPDVAGEPEKVAEAAGDAAKEAELKTKKGEPTREELSQARKAFLDASALVGTQRIGPLAALLAAEAAARLGDLEAASADLRALIAKIPITDPVRFLATHKLARLAEGSGDTDKAQQLVHEAAETTRPFADWALLDEARLAQAAGDFGGAEERLALLESSFAQTSLTADVRARRASLAQKPDAAAVEHKSP